MRFLRKNCSFLDSFVYRRWKLFVCHLVEKNITHRWLWHSLGVIQIIICYPPPSPTWCLVTVSCNYAPKDCHVHVFHRFKQAKFDNGGSILSSSQYLLLHQLPQKWCSLLKWSKSTENNWLASNDLNLWNSLYYLNDPINDLEWDEPLGQNKSISKKEECKKHFFR